MFHEEKAKKFLFNKLDPSMTFAFYLRSADDLQALKNWQE